MDRLGLALGRLGVGLGAQHFLDNDMLASPSRNSHVRGVDQCEPQHKEFWVAVEYRLNIIPRYLGLCTLSSCTLGVLIRVSVPKQTYL